MLKKFIYD